MCTTDCKVSKLSDVKREYLTRLQELGVPTQDQPVHSTRFKDKLLDSSPGLSAYVKGREVLLVFENGIALVLSESFEKEQDCKIISLTFAAKLQGKICSTKVTSSMGCFPKHANNALYRRPC